MKRSSLLTGIPGLAALGLAGTLALAGCASSASAAKNAASSRQDTVAALQKAVTQLQGFKAGHIDATAALTQVRLPGMSDFTSSNGKTSDPSTWKPADLTLSLTGDVSQSGGGAADLKATVSGDGDLVNLLKLVTGSGQVELKVVDGTVYVNIGRPMQGKNWLKIPIPPSALGGTGVVGGGPVTLTPADIASLTKALDTIDAKEVGTDTINGTKADHYQGTLDKAHLQKALADAKTQADKADLQDALKSFSAKDAPSSVVIDLWLASNDDRPLKISADAEGVEGGKVTFSVTLSNWNQSVSIAKPSDSDTYGLNAFMGGLNSLAGVS